MCSQPLLFLFTTQTVQSMKVIIFEDEPTGARRLKKMIQGINPQLHIVATLESVEEGIRWFSTQTPPDLIIMDIHLSDGSALELISHIGLGTPIIFTTAYQDYAIDAFKTNSIDYLLKPIREADLRLALDKFNRQYAKSKTSLDIKQLSQHIQQQQSSPYLCRILIKYKDILKAIPISEVAYFYSENRITRLSCFNGKSYPIDFTLDQLAIQLDPDIFFRANRQLIVREEAIDKMLLLPKSKLELVLSPPLTSPMVVSSQKSAEFKHWLKG